MTRVALRSAALSVIVATGVAIGLVEKAADLRRAFRDAPETTVPREIQRGARDIAAAWPPPSAGAFFSSEVGWETCGVWQRVLHPRVVICVRPSDPATVRLFEDTRADGRVRWAFGKGTPPGPFVPDSRVTRLPSGFWIADLREVP